MDLSLLKVVQFTTINKDNSIYINRLWQLNIIFENNKATHHTQQKV